MILVSKQKLFMPEKKAQDSTRQCCEIHAQKFHTTVLAHLQIPALLNKTVFFRSASVLRM
jgi:hypothetical protein